MNIQFLMTRAKCGFSFSCCSRHFGDIGRTVQAGASLGVAGIEAASNAAISAATNATNAKINKNTNETNRRIAEETNAMNYQIHQEDMNFNAEQAQLQREWDSPEQERARLVAAGYNPLALGDFSSGGQSAASAPSAIPMEGATMNPLHLDTPTIDFLSHALVGSQARNFNAGADLQLAEKAKIDLDVEKFPETWQSEQNIREWTTKHLQKLTAFEVAHAAYFKDLKLSNMVERRYKRALTEQVKALKDLYEENARFAKEIHPKELTRIDAEINKIKSETRVNYSQITLNQQLTEESQTREDLNTQTLDFNDSTFYERVRAVGLQNVLDSEQIKTFQQQQQERVFRMADTLNNLDMTKEERVAFALLLETHPNISAAELAGAIDAVGSKPEKQWSRSLSRQAIDIAKQVVVAGLVGAAIYFSGGTASAAILGAMGSSTAVGVANSAAAAAETAPVAAQSGVPPAPYN